LALLAENADTMLDGPLSSEASDLAVEIAADDESVTTGTITPLGSNVPVTVVSTESPRESFVVNVDVIMRGKENWVEGNGFKLKGFDVEAGSDAVF